MRGSAARPNSVTPSGTAFEDIRQHFRRQRHAGPDDSLAERRPETVAARAAAAPFRRRLFVSLRRRWEYWPFLIALGLFALGLLGLGISMFPFVVPGAVTIHQAAAPESSLWFMLVGASVLIPIILTYSGYSYWVFRGKAGQEGYH